MNKNDIPILLFIIGLTVYSIYTFLRGYHYNKNLQQQDKETQFVNGGSLIGEFFRIVVPYFPIGIAKYFYMGLGTVLFILSMFLITGFLSS